MFRLFRSASTATLWLLIALLPAVVVGADKTDTFVLEVEGMVWDECAHSVESALEKIPGVVSVKVNLNAGEVTVEAQPGKVKWEQLVEAVNKAQDSSHTFKAKLKKSPETK